MKTFEMAKVEWNIIFIPKREIIAVCGKCGTEISRWQYENYEDQKSKLEKLKMQELVCLNCGKVFRNSVETY